MKKYFVYILKCADNSYYTGSTNNLERRINEHNSGKYKGYTSTRLPVQLVYFQEFSDVKDAISNERKIKKWSRKKKEALINGDFYLLHKYSECKNETHYKNRDKLKRESL